MNKETLIALMTVLAVGYVGLSYHSWEVEGMSNELGCVWDSAAGKMRCLQ